MDHRYVYPPDIQKGKKHGLATRIFKIIDPRSTERCECCERPIGTNEKFNNNCCFDPQTLAFLGQGIPLYFLYLRNSILLLLLLTLVFSAFNLYTNYLGDDCDGVNDACQLIIFNQLSVINKSSNTKFLQFQNYILLSSVIITLICLLLIRRGARLLENKCDKVVDSPSDYSLILSRLPQDYTEKDILEMIERRKTFLSPKQKQITDNLAVEKITIGYRFGDIRRVQEKNDENFKKSIKDKTQFVKIEEPEATKYGPTAIITFSDQHSKSFFLEQPKFYQKMLHFIWDVFVPLSDFQVKGKNIIIARAPEPDDVIWENCGISFGGTVCRRILSKFIMLFLLALSIGVQIGYQYVDSNYLINMISPNVSSIIFSLIVTIFNTVIGMLLVSISKSERLHTVTEYNTTLAVKISIYQFINAGILVIISGSILDFSKFSLTKGMAADITQIMILNIITPNVSLFLLNYWAPGKWWSKRKLEKDPKSKEEFSQMEVNEAYQGTENDLAARYSFILKTLSLTALYASFVPVVIPLSMVSLTFNYMIQKLLYQSNSYKIPNMTSSILDNQMIQMLEYFPLIMSLGNYFVYLYFVYFKFNELPDYFSIPIYISLIVSAINLVLPMGKINQKVFPIDEGSFRKLKFKQVEKNFLTDYDIANPVYRMKNKKQKNFNIYKSVRPGGNLFEMIELSHLESPNNPLLPKNTNPSLNTSSIQQQVVQQGHFGQNPESQVFMQSLLKPKTHWTPPGTKNVFSPNNKANNNLQVPGPAAAPVPPPQYQQQQQQFAPIAIPVPNNNIPTPFIPANNMMGSMNGMPGRMGMTAPPPMGMGMSGPMRPLGPPAQPMNMFGMALQGGMGFH